MAEYTIGFKDEASPVAQRIRQSVAAMRSELKAVGAVRLADGTKFATWAKATALQTAGRVGSEVAAAAMIRRTTAANLAAARAAGTRAAAEGKLALSLMRTLHYEMRLSHYRGRGGAAGGAGGGGGAGGPPGGDFVTDPLGRFGKAAPWLLGGAAAGVAGVGVYMGARAGLQALSMAAGAAISVLSGLAAAVGRAARAVGGLAFEFGKATVSAFDFRTRATMAFQALRGNGQVEFEKMKALATEMGTSLEGTFSGIRALSAAGFGASEAEQMFKRLQDMKGIGLDQPTLDRLTLAMSQIKGAGVLQGDELRQIQETGINVGKIWESMAKSTGKTTAELKKMKEAGALSADVAIAGIMDAMAGMAGGREAGALGQEMGRKTAEGFGQRVSLLKSLFFDRLAEESTGGISGLLGTLSSAADDALGWFKSADAGAFFAEIGGGIKTMAADFGTAIKSDTAREYLVEVKELFLGAWHVGEGLWSVTKAFVEGFAGHKVDLEGTKGSLEGIAEFLKSEGASGMMRRLGEATSFAAEMVIFLATNFRSAAAGAQGMAEWANSLVGSIGTLATSLYEGGANAARSLISGFVGGIFGGQGQVLAAAASVGQTALAAISGSLDAHSPSRATEKLGGFTTIGLARGMIAANDNSRRAAATVAGDVRTEMAAGLGVSSGAGAASPVMMAGATTTTANTRSIGNITIHINGNADQRTIDDLEARIIDLLERVA